MDKFYDIIEAGKTLERISAERRASSVAANKTAMKHLADLDADEMDVVETGNRKNWRLCVRDEDDQVADEVIFRVQGVLLKNNLTPKNTAACPARKIAFICQHLEICGLTSETFLLAIAKTEEVNQRFHEHFSSVTVVDLARPTTSLGPGLSAANRLFTSKSDAPTEQDNDFVEGVDPTGALARLKNRDLIHGPDNMVRYFRRVTDEQNSERVRYDVTVPGVFKVGDIVEVQLSFIAIQSAHQDVKVTTRLQALTLLDSSFTKAAAMARNLAKVESKPQQAVRRKVGYFYEDEEEASRATKKK
ncbi:hypothetical protein C8R47DRAFT_1225490 [Mycena vitilis]|nr:hypothetical protein C8R47DRAFT_1225490 [Mycena vitilis]